MNNPNNPNEYNGWTNYATWRVNLEWVSEGGLSTLVREHVLGDAHEGIVDDLLGLLDPEKVQPCSRNAWTFHEEIQDYVQPYLEELFTTLWDERTEGVDDYVTGYANAFVSDVSWWEIAWQQTADLLDDFVDLIEWDEVEEEHGKQAADRLREYVQQRDKRWSK